MANPLAVSLHASGVETASGSGDAVDIGAARSCLRLRLAVSALSGTDPTLDVTIETADEDTGPWTPVLDAMPEAFSAGSTEQTIAPCRRYVRATWEIDGTDPAFTFSLTGEAHQIYCDPGDLARFSLPASVMDAVSASVKADCCLRATNDAAAKLAGAATLPLISWGDELRGAVADIAAFYAMKHRGFDPTAGPDALIRQGYTDAMAMLRDASMRKVKLDYVDSTVDTSEGHAVVVSRTRRGW